jgi:hypothetical protein
MPGSEGGRRKRVRATRTPRRRPTQRAPYRCQGKPWHRSALQNLDDFDIIQTYGAEYRGIVCYYLLAQDVCTEHA